MSGLPLRCRNSACWQSSLASSGFTVGRGMRANEENSSTMRPMSPTWRMMVSVQIEKVSGSSLICLR